MANIFVIDDDLKFCEGIAGLLNIMGHSTAFATTLLEGLQGVKRGDVDIVFLDVTLPDGNGLEIIPALRQTPSAPEVIIVTGSADADGAELAMKSGAWDYLKKPATRKTVEFHVSRAIQYRNDKSVGSRPTALKLDGIVGSSRQFRSCLDVLAGAVNSDAAVLITGETGTGKELFARAIHANSPRAKARFVVLDCAALPETLVESTLFGHVKGAFTGADRTSEGLIRQSDKGTLFLDEVGELPLQIQKPFLRVLQEGRFRPVGATGEVEADFRIISATNRDLNRMVREGLFRKDLLYRLGNLKIRIPPLRERTEDIPGLLLHYLSKLCQRYGTGAKGYDPAFLETVLAYDWPGNVRELVHCIEASLSAAWDQPTLFPAHLPPEIRAQVARASVGKSVPAEGAEPGTSERKLQRIRDYREANDKAYLDRLMRESRSNIGKACEISGLSVSRLYALLKKHGIS